MENEKYVTWDQVIGIIVVGVFLFALFTAGKGILDNTYQRGYFEGKQDGYEQEFSDENPPVVSIPLNPWSHVDSFPTSTMCNSGRMLFGCK